MISTTASTSLSGPPRPRSPQDVYARLLLSSLCGYPLWTPEPSIELLAKRPDGLRIGDVGVVTNDGGFDVFFNLCLPENHPFHRRGVPDGFANVDPGELDIRTIPDAENPGRVISSPSVSPEPSTDVSQRDRSTTRSYGFFLSSAEGALLVLPKGAERYDLLNEDLFLQQAEKHGLEWYNYAVNRRHRLIGPDSLYLITGFHKTRCWLVSAFENITENERYRVLFKYAEGASQAYSCDTTRTLDWRGGPLIDNGIPNQAVFIRGFKIMLRKRLLPGARRVAVEADTPSIRFSSPSGTVWRSIRRLRMTNEATHGQAATRGNSTPTEQGSQSDVSQLEDAYDVMSVEVKRIPDAHLVFHPLDAINHYLLQKEPSANIAIAHDNHWISILEEGLLTVEELQQETLLETALSQNYRVVVLKDIVRLERKRTISVDEETTQILRHAIMPPTNDVLCWTNQDPRESQLFNSWGVLYRFSTVVDINNGKSTTTLWRTVRANREDRVAMLEWASNSGLGRAVIGKNVIAMSDLVRPQARSHLSGSRTFNAPDGVQYRWRPSSTSSDILLEDPIGNVVAFFHPTRPTRFQIGDVYGELHFLRNAGAGTIIHPPMMDMVTVTAMLYRFCMAFGL